MALDFSYHDAPYGNKVIVLSLIDEASKYHVARVVRKGKFKSFNDLGNCDTETLLESLHEWTRYLLAPKVIHCDDEAIFSSNEFKVWCSQRAIQIKPCAGEAHWQNGIVERHIGTLKSILQRLFIHGRLICRIRHRLYYR